MPKLFVERESTVKKSRSRYEAVTKRGGKLFVIPNAGSDSVFESQSKGRPFVERTLARSLGVLDTETGKLVTSPMTPQGYRQSKKPSSFIIQSNALSSQGEKSEIQQSKKSKKIF